MSYSEKDGQVVLTDSPPEGFHWEWVQDKSFEIGGDGRKCRMKRCGKDAVARLWRKSVTGLRPWYYCENHLYGRRVNDLIVETRILVENEGNPNFTPYKVEK